MRPQVVRARHRWGRTASLAAIGCFGLAIGVLVYLTDRAASRAVLMPTIGSHAGMHLFGVVGLWLPSFVHPFAFSLFTAAALPSRRMPRYGACVAWCAVNVAFEIGQHPQVRQHLAAFLEAALGRTPIVRSLANYFLRGTFDLGDIAAALLAAFAAAVVLGLLDRGVEARLVE